MPTTGLDLLHLAAHEVYPGHHTEHAAKEQLLIRDQGLIEEGIQLVPTPQAVLSEGIAETGADLVLDAATRDAAFDDPAAARDRVRPELAERIAKAGEPLGRLGLDAALMIHEDGATIDEAEEYVARGGSSRRRRRSGQRPLRHRPDLARLHDHLLRRRASSAAPTSSGDPARFRTLLTEHVRIGELLPP